MPPAGRGAGARPARPERKREPLTEEEAELVREMVIYEDPQRLRPQQAAGPRDAGRDQDPPASRPAARRPRRRRRRRGPSWSTGSTRTRRARCWSRETARAAGHFAKAFSGRTARKVYWALVVGVPSLGRRADRPAARQAAGHRRREDACRRGARASGEDPLAGDRPRRQPRRLGRASAADRPHAPASRAHGGDRPSDRRRRQIWRAGSVPDRRDQPQAAPPRAADPDRRARTATIDVTAELPPHFAESLGTLGLRADGRRHACRSTSPSRRSRPRRSSARSPRPPRSRAASARGERRSRGPQSQKAGVDASESRRSTGRTATQMLRLRCGPGLRAHLRRIGRRPVRRPCAGPGDGRGHGSSSTSARRNRDRGSCSPSRRVLISVTGREAYQSANWYVSEDQVPTWHYEAVEIEGEARPLSRRRAGRPARSPERA